jgi:hypothetical protein
MSYIDKQSGGHGETTPLAQPSRRYLIYSKVLIKYNPLSLCLKLGGISDMGRFKVSFVEHSSEKPLKRALSLVLTFSHSPVTSKL